jgi:RNAse (barnase) inhibitor barstar
MVLAPLAPGQDSTSLYPSLKGWTFSEDETVYNPDNLWDVIDGAADLFLEYGFVDLRIGRYHKGEDSEIKVELYRFDSMADAFGMYSQERNPKHAFIDIGVQAHREEGVLNFLTGVYYVKIMTHIRGQEALDAMTTISKSLNTHLMQENKWPRILNLLPEQQKHPNSEQYIARNFLGYAFFRQAYVAQYGNDKTFRIFVIAANSSAEASSAFNEFVKTSPGGAIDTSTFELYSVRDRYNGLVELLREGNFIAGTVDLEDRSLAKTYIDDILKRIDTFTGNNRISK